MEPVIREILNEILLRLNAENPSVYYLSASDIAVVIYDWIQKHDEWDSEKRAKVKSLTSEDIRYILSFEEQRESP